ncbi:MAG: hypothetical protein WKG07_07340 [Hymenobacter sp.]
MPSAIVSKVVDDLLKYKVVQRALLGVRYSGSGCQAGLGERSSLA